MYAICVHGCIVIIKEKTLIFVSMVLYVTDISKKRPRFIQNFAINQIQSSVQHIYLCYSPWAFEAKQPLFVKMLDAN